MSKLITGTVAIPDLDIVREACKALGWSVSREQAQSLRVEVVAGDAKYHPYIDVALREGKAQITYDHWMSFGTGNIQSIGADDHDDTTRRVIGQFKQACAKVQVERLLSKQRANWRVEQRADGAQVLVVRR